MSGEGKRAGDYWVDRNALDAALADICGANCQHRLSAAILADARMAQGQGLTEQDWKHCWNWRICAKKGGMVGGRDDAIGELKEAGLWPWH